MLRHATLCAFVVVMMAIGSTYAQKRGDGMNPSEETICDQLRGSRAFGLCNAYCEAKDCDSPNPKGSKNSCNQLLSNFKKKTDQQMPCVEPPEPGSQLGSCPCNFDVQFWIDPNTTVQILQTVTLPACDLAVFPRDACITCSVEMSAFDPFTFLNIVVDVWDGGIVSREDRLDFLIREPSPVGECFAEGSFDFQLFHVTKNPVTNEDDELPVTVEEFPACMSDMTDLRAAYFTLGARCLLGN